MLRYPQSLGCMHGGEGHSAMRSLLLGETVINESRNCSFMVRKKRERKGSPVASFGKWNSCTFKFLRGWRDRRGCMKITLLLGWFLADG